MGFCEYHDVDVVGLHVVDDCVDFGWFPESCDIPLAHSDLVSCGDFDVMGFPVCVVVWVLDVCLEPMGSCGFGGVEVLCRGMCGYGGCGGLWGRNTVAGDGVWVVCELKSGL